MKAPPPELRGFVDRLLDRQTLTRTEMARLEEYLEDDDHLAYYLDVLQQEAAMPEALAEVPRAVIPYGRRPATLAIAGMAAAAACAMFFLGLAIGGRESAPAPVGNATATPTGAAPADIPPARVTGLVGVRWSSPASPGLLARSGALDKLSIETGLAEITYASGVRVTIEGPAEFDVTDHESGRLIHGKIVASVPRGAEGFRIDYADGTVVDLGTEFAMKVSADGPVEIGVFDGEIELHTATADPMPLFGNHAVRHDHRDFELPVRAIPFDREKFVRRLPTRDFPWVLDSMGGRELVIDVSHLVWKASEYRAIFKWMDGQDAVIIEGVELRLDGRTVAADPHSGATGFLGIVRDNVFSLDLPEGRFATGRWTLHATLRPYPRKDGLAGYTGPVNSTGILQFEEGLVSQAGREDFIGRWSYHHLGTHFVREFHPDGTLSLFQNGELQPAAFGGSRWTVEDGTLAVDVPGTDLFERHILRNRDTLVFTTNPYENAIRE